MKATTGYDLTQLIIGSEGTLALVTEAILRLYPGPAHQATVLAPFPTLDEVTAAVPRIVASGIGPLILEYIDNVTMAAITGNVGLDLGVPEDIKEAALAYLVVMMENAHADRLDEDVHRLGESAARARRHRRLRAAADGGRPAHRRPGEGVLGGQGGRRRRHRRHRRAPGLGGRVHGQGGRAGRRPTARGSPGCGHAGDGNVHMSVFQPDPEERHKVMRGLFEAGMALGGAISGEHGIGRAKKKYFLELEDPVKVDLMRRIKTAFDPNGILNPGTLFD